MCKLEKQAAVFFILALLVVSLNLSAAASGSTFVRVSGSETLVIGTWDLPWPINDYRIQFFAIPSFDGGNRLSWSVDRDLISPGETMTLTFNLESGTYDLHMDFRVVAVKKSTASTVFDKTVGINLGSMSVPGSWSSQSIAIPLIPFELSGIPIELSIFFRLSITNNFIVTLSMYGLQQSIATLNFTSSGANAISFSKQSGIGAEVRLTDAAVMARGGITVSAGLSVVGLPTPLKIDFATVPIVDWTTHSAQNIEVAVLKTPIAIDVSLSPEVVNIGETVTVSGRLTPPAAGIPLHLIVEGTPVATAESQMDGLFTLEWKPPNPGTFSIFVKALETRYTTSATSSTIQFTVNRPQETHFTWRMLLGTVVAVVIIAIAVLLFKRRSRLRA